MDYSKIPTKRLLKMYQRERSRLYSMADDDWEYAEHLAIENGTTLHKEYDLPLQEMKAELAKREHVPRKNKNK